MLGGLFANASVEKVLLFLFVNQKAYPSQISKALGLSLTPIQKAFAHLEHHKIVVSEMYKNKKVYSLNPNYPLFNEIESLLKRAYSLLSAEDKKRFSFMNLPQSKDSQVRFEKSVVELKDFWKKLHRIDVLILTARLVDNQGTKTKEGQAKITKSYPSDNQILFHEEGQWQEEMSTTSFSNQFLWTLDLDRKLVTLEHMRYGPKNPIFLFNLAVSRKKCTLTSVDPHLCKDDTYLGALTWNQNTIELNMRVIGPKKNQFLCYQYKIGQLKN